MLLYILYKIYFNRLGRIAMFSNKNYMSSMFRNLLT